MKQAVDEKMPMVSPIYPTCIDEQSVKRPFLKVPISISKASNSLRKANIWCLKVLYKLG